MKGLRRSNSRRRSRGYIAPGMPGYHRKVRRNARKALRLAMPPLNAHMQRMIEQLKRVARYG